MSEKFPGPTKARNIERTPVSAKLERAPDLEAIRQRSEDYDAQGISESYARELIAHIKEMHEGRRADYVSPYGLHHLETFYLNSSDPLPVLEENISVEGEHVITVGGSGDFAKIFLANGAREISTFDLSLPGVFYNELSTVALQEMSFSTYKKFLNAWKYKDHDDREEKTLFDPDLYVTIRGHLSVQAKAYFDELTRDEALFVRGKGPLLAQTRRWNFKRYEDSKEGTYIGDVVTTAPAYKALQTKARKASFHYVWASAKGMAASIADARHVSDFPAMGTGEREKLLPTSLSHELRDADTVYLTNVDYNPLRQVALAKLFFKAGVPRVVMSCATDAFRNGEVQEASGKHTDAKGIVHEASPITIDGVSGTRFHAQEFRHGFEFDSIIELKAPENPEMK